MRPMTRTVTDVLALAPALALTLAACGGGGGGPTAPSVASTPVAGTPSPSPSPTPMPEPSAAPTPAPTPPPASVVLRSARLRGVNGHSTSGTARIVREGDDYRLELLQDFRIDTSSIDVYLARQDGTVTNADLNLGNLRSTSGAQRYDLPHDGSSYGYVLMWCRPFRIPIGAGELR